MRQFYRRANKQSQDQRLNAPLVDERPSGPIACRLVDRVNVADDVERARLGQRFEALACALPDDDALIFRRMMRDASVPRKDRDRVLKKVRELMRLPKNPRSVDHPDDIEGPSHCGRTVRRLEQERRAANDWEEATEELDAAE